MILPLPIYLQQSLWSRKTCAFRLHCQDVTMTPTTKTAADSGRLHLQWLLRFSATLGTCSQMEEMKR
jgi:hypothetical protein